MKNWGEYLSLYWFKSLGRQGDGGKEKYGAC